MDNYKLFKQKLFNYEFIEFYLEEILSINDYIPRVLMFDDNIRELRFKKDVIRKDISKDHSLNKLFVRQHALENFANHKGIDYKILFALANIIVFIDIYPQFEKIVDDDVLEYWVDYFENKYDLNVLKYVGSYEAIRPLIKNGGLDKC